MEVLDARADPGEFFARLSGCRARALLLDYDGTLAPFAAGHADVVPYPGVRDSLLRILAAPQPTHVAIVSGRAVETLAALVAIPGGVELWGSHGLERRTVDGEMIAAPGRPAETDFLEQICSWVCTEGWQDMLERKPRGMAVHGRGRDPALYEAARAALIDRWERRARSLGLETLEFDAGIELRPRGGHKGLVVEETLARLGEEACVAYLGDDRTDEDAFRALGRRGLSVLVRAEKRPTSAHVWIRPPDELLAFLSEWERAVGAEGKAQ